MPPTYSYGCWLPSSLVSQAVLVTPEPMLQSPRLVWLPSVVTPEVQLFGGGDGGGGEGGGESDGESDGETAKRRRRLTA
jgi:hypothetical protein